MRQRLRFLVPMVAAVLLVPGSGASAAPSAASAPQITDPAGDANGANTQLWNGGQLGLLMDQARESAFGANEDPWAPGVQSGPASLGAADITSVRFATTYVAVPTPAGGVHYEPTGLSVTFTTTASMTDPAASETLIVNTDSVFDDGAGACRIGFALGIRGTATTSSGPKYQPYFDAGAPGFCADDSAGVPSPAWTVAVDPSGTSATVTYPFSSLTELQLAETAPGAVFTSPRADSNVSVWTADVTAFGQDFTVGSDLPEDVA
ncbi:MAG: hypothetical protein ABR600_00805 [Actinomycetota bacterium]